MFITNVGKVGLFLLSVFTGCAGVSSTDAMPTYCVRQQCWIVLRSRGGQKMYKSRKARE